MVWLCCLFKLGVLNNADLRAIGLLIFPAYVRVVHKLISEYSLEPAGSHGAWSLDDYHFLPFVFGAAQFVQPEDDESAIAAGTTGNLTSASEPPHPPPTAAAADPTPAELTRLPKLPLSSIHDEFMLREYGLESLYLLAVNFVKGQIRGGVGLSEAAPLLDDISRLKTWDHALRGLFKMYAAEVLNKFPVAQHMLFGGLITSGWKDVTGAVGTGEAATSMEGGGAKAKLHPAIAAAMAGGDGPVMDQFVKYFGVARPPSSRGMGGGAGGPSRSGAYGASGPPSRGGGYEPPLVPGCEYELPSSGMLGVSVKGWKVRYS
jgi:hypothetical protein